MRSSLEKVDMYPEMSNMKPILFLNVNLFQRNEPFKISAGVTQYLDSSRNIPNTNPSPVTVIREQDIHSVIIVIFTPFRLDNISQVDSLFKT